MNSIKKVSGTVFDVQGFSVHDGPGTRTVFFLSGCPLSCKWCSNPEGRFRRPVPMYSAAKCAHDGDCVKACPKKAISVISGDTGLSGKSTFMPGDCGSGIADCGFKSEIINPESGIHNQHNWPSACNLSFSRLVFDRSQCLSCSSHECAEACCAGALRIAGYEISLEDVIRILKRDRFFWGEKGGITLTGGEPLAQPEFTYSILEYCKKNYIHTAIETCGYVPEEKLLAALPLTDWMFFDIKHMDSDRHMEGTGVENSLILKNLKMVSECFQGELVIRMVMIPGYNDSDGHIIRLAEFISSLSLKSRVVNFLPVHHLAREKYNMLGMEYFTRNIEFVKQADTDRIKKVMASHGIECYIGSNTPF